jgi:hypothetical protein
MCQQNLVKLPNIKFYETSFSCSLIIIRHNNYYTCRNKQNDKTDVAKSIGGILKLFFENAPQRTKEIERNSIYSNLPVHTTPVFIPVVDILWRLHIHAVTSFISYKYAMSRKSMLFYQVLRRITIKNISGINGILHDIIFNIVLPHLIPHPLNILAMPWRESIYIKVNVCMYVCMFRHNYFPWMV